MKVNLEIVVEVDVPSVLEQLEDYELFAEAQIDADMCAEVLGGEVLEAFNEKQIVEYYDAHKLLDEIGEDVVKEYFELVSKPD